MMEELHKRRKDHSDDSISFLTNLKPVEWLELAYTVGTPANSPLSLGEYAEQLEKDVEASYPTKVFGERLRQGVLQLDSLPVAKVARFLQEHQDFDIASCEVEPFLEEHRLDDAVLKSALLKVQRVHALSANWHETGVILNRGIDFGKSHHAVRQGSVHELVGDEIATLRANLIYTNAQETL